MSSPNAPFPLPWRAFWLALAVSSMAALLPGALVGRAEAAAPAPKASPALSPDAEPPADPEPAAEPALVQLREARQELASVLAQRVSDPELLDTLAELLMAADPALVDLLLPASPQGPLPDRRGEDLRVDLWAADIRLDGSWLRGVVQGDGAAENGVWLEVDTRGGPAPDLQLGFGRGWSREATLDGSAPSPMLARDAIPVIDGNTVRFEVDLAQSARFDAAHPGYAIATIKSFDGRVVDVGPGGLLGPPPEEAIEVLVHLAGGDPIVDPDLAVALAITFGAVRATVADDVVATVDADALAWLRYGEGLDALLVEQGASWSFRDQSAFAKLVWAWPAGQGVAYGSFAMADSREPLTLARYRFVVPSVENLEALRALAPWHATAAETADHIDAFAWDGIQYRTNTPLMRTLCANGGATENDCAAWRKEQLAGTVLAKVDGVVVSPHDAVSPSLQLFLREEKGTFVGDCAMATSVAIAMMQSVGLPAIGMGWAGADTSTPTHDIPLWLDGDTFRATQSGPGRDWARETAYVYFMLPAVHPVNAFTLAPEPNGWPRGGAVVGGWTQFLEVRTIIRDGLPASTVGAWVDVQAAGGWPTW